MASQQQHVLRLESVRATGFQLSMRYSFDQYQFSTSYWYDFDLESLNTLYSPEFMENVYFHCAAFEILKFCSLKPDILDWGPYSKWHTAEFEQFWKTVTIKAWSQWRYENNVTDWKSPSFTSKPVLTKTPTHKPVEVKRDQDSGPPLLVCCGGGKDSLAMFELIDRAAIPFDSLSYSHTFFGRSSVRQQLTAKVVASFKASSNNDNVKSHRQFSMFEDFYDTPLLDSLGKKLGVSTLSISGEMLAAWFAIVPVILHYKYTALALGNERSSNDGNLFWKEGNEEVNHQWMKSFEAEKLFHDYLQQNLICNASVFSVLQPIHDMVIISVASDCPESIIHTYSCNFNIPWCLRCPKCCYVWLLFNAFLPADVVESTFSGENLLDIPENITFFVELLGLTDKKPFECVGEFDETKLAFEMCRHKGIRGRSMEIYEKEVVPSMSSAKIAELVEKYTKVHCQESNIPAKYQEQLFPVLEQAGVNARQKLVGSLLEQ